MSADPFEIRRIDLDAETSVWIPSRRPAITEEPAPPEPAQPVERVRAAAVAGAATAVCVALVRFGPTREGLLAAWVLALLTILAAIDLEARLLPNRIVFPATLCAIAWQAVFFPDGLVECLVSGVVAGAVLLLPTPVALGMLLVGGARARRTALPFGPFLALGAAIALLA